MEVDHRVVPNMGSIKNLMKLQTLVEEQCRQASKVFKWIDTSSHGGARGVRGLRAVVARPWSRY